MTPLQRDIAMKMGLGAGAKRPQAPRTGLMGMMPAVGTPAFAGLGQAAATGLQLSGYRDRPITTGEGLGAMMSAGLKAYSEAKRANLADQIALAELAAKTTKSGALEGKSIFAQTGNTLLELAPKIKSGKATAPEKALYAYVYGAVSKPQTQTTFDQDGNKTITEIPAQDLPQDLFPRPEGFREPLTTTQPSAKSLKDAAKLKDSRKMLQNLNAYRQIIENPEFDLVSQAGGALGFPSGLAATAKAAANALRMDLKILYELGALVGGDFQILDSLLVDPNSPDAIKGGRDLLLAQIDQLERQLELDMGVKGVTLRGTKSIPIVANSKEEYEAAPNYTYVRLPNDKIVYKDPRGK
tara:strand:- start:914 stop:1975 length:1062 start_codon:yes stop_codon:yes gene_type:complete